MAKKLSKTLLSALLCATLVVGTAATVYAAGTVNKTEDHSGSCCD